MSQIKWPYRLLPMEAGRWEGPSELWIRCIKEGLLQQFTQHHAILGLNSYHLGRQAGTGTAHNGSGFHRFLTVGMESKEVKPWTGLWGNKERGGREDEKKPFYSQDTGQVAHTDSNLRAGQKVLARDGYSCSSSHGTKAGVEVEKGRILRMEATVRANK